MKEQYPVDENNRPLGVHELGLPASNLDLDDPKNWNNHHMRWLARDYASRPIYSELRLLENEQVRLPLDLHNLGSFALHRTFSEPPMPTLKQAMDRLVEGYEDGERFKVYNKNVWAYTYQDFTKDKMEAMMTYYSELRSLGYE